MPILVHQPLKKYNDINAKPIGKTILRAATVIPVLATTVPAVIGSTTTNNGKQQTVFLVTFWVILLRKNRNWLPRGTSEILLISKRNIPKSASLEILDQPAMIIP